jgi:hypothetical protein
MGGEKIGGTSAPGRFSDAPSGTLGCLASVMTASGILGGFNRSSQHFHGSFEVIRREFPLVFSSREFFVAWC